MHEPATTTAPFRQHAPADVIMADLHECALEAAVEAEEAQYTEHHTIAEARAEAARVLIGIYARATWDETGHVMDHHRTVHQAIWAEAKRIVDENIADGMLGD
jgi:hypothetical protein